MWLTEIMQVMCSRFEIGGADDLLYAAGVIFSIVLLIDCLKRDKGDFYKPITKEGEYDKLIWAIAILLTFEYYFVGAIVYFFVVKKGRPEEKE